MESKVRKIQLTGGSTYIVSLPSQWISRNSLGKGSEVLVTEDGEAVTVLPSGLKHDVVKRIGVSADITMSKLTRSLIAVYIGNFDTLIVSSAGHMSESVRNTVKQFAKQVMGVEIFEESSSQMVLQNVLDSSSFPFPKATRRMSLNVESMLRDVIKGIRERDMVLLRNVIPRDDDIDRYQWYIFRETFRGRDSGKENTYYLLLSRIMERIADHSVNICRMLTEEDTDLDMLSNVALSIMESSVRTVSDAISAFYSGQFDILNDIIDRKIQIAREREQASTMIGKTPKLSLLHRVLEEMIRIGYYGTDIAELAMDRYVSIREEIEI
ncbi:MAG: phosphate uptake regulator PhoU [Candidatus Thermoplasmatota archaeon]|jgi:phosphate uptake regulator|nr:phosphate uptake regulator PhoU [Candidatus Thermoplasmatota archaeon]MCL5793282.1 phosphate uptake regulator PhoU [Candidatus Thermoplasmatota archaeon]